MLRVGRSIFLLVIVKLACVFRLAAVKLCKFFSCYRVQSIVIVCQRHVKPQVEQLSVASKQRC